MYSKAAHLDELITGISSLTPLFGVEIMHLVDRTYLFKISDLVYGGNEIVTSLEKTDRDSLWRVQESAESPFVSVKINGLENILKQLTL
jgi:hypothetical protein